jgi:hypothetical protein
MKQSEWREMTRFSSQAATIQAHIPSPIEGFSCGTNASNASIVDQLAAPGAADIEFGAPASGRLFRAPDFS